MAGARRTTRQNQYRTNRQGQAYVYGNVVPKTEVNPQRVPQENPKPRVKTRRKAGRKQKKANGISPAYTAFLAAAAVTAVMICVGYLHLQADIVNRSEHITALQEELADLNEQNTTAYNSAESSINLETVRARAVGEMGMVYAAWGNVIEYDSPAKDTVVQYSDIPEDGILAKSRTALR